MPSQEDFISFQQDIRDWLFAPCRMKSHLHFHSIASYGKSAASEIENFLQSSSLRKEIEQKWRLSTNFDCAMQNQPNYGRDWTEIRRYLDKDLVSKATRGCSSCCIFLVEYGLIPPSSYNCAGECLFFLACKEGVWNIAQCILRKITPEHLLHPVWFNGDERGPSYLQFVTAFPDYFQLVWEKLRSVRPASVAAELKAADRYTISRWITPHLAHDLLEKGINIDEASGPGGHSIWHAAVSQKDPLSLFEWLFNNSSVFPDILPATGKSALVHAIETGQAVAADWLSRHSSVEAQLIALEVTAKRHAADSVALFHLLLDHLHLQARYDLWPTIETVHAIGKGFFAKERHLKMKRRREASHRFGVLVKTGCNYDEGLRAAKTIGLRNIEIVCFYIGLSIADSTDCQWLPGQRESIVDSKSVNSQLHDSIREHLVADHTCIGGSC